METQKANVKTPIKNRKGFDLSHTHITTERFFEPNVALIQEAAANQTYKIKQGTFRRVTPMPLPPLTNLKCETKYFYVPFVSICPYFREFQTNTVYAAYDGLKEINKLGVVKNTDIQTLFTHRFAVEGSDFNYANQVPSNSAYDFATYTSPNRTCWRFTTKGRIAYKLLKQLGYDFRAQTVVNNTDEFSSLPLIAFAKVVFDHFINPQFINNSTRYATIRQLFNSQKVQNLTYVELDLIMDLSRFLCYGHDYFVDSFVNPNGPNYQETFNAIEMLDNTGTENYVTSDGPGHDGTATYNNQDDELNFITKHGIDLLKGLQNWLTRNQLAGGRFIDRLLVQFGYKPTDIDARISSYIDKYTQNVKIQPVLNNSNNGLGDYAGYGQAAEEQQETNTIIINTDNNPGYIIAIDTIVPDIFYSSGVLRQNMHITPFDFYTPEFDCLGTQAIAQAEILMNKDEYYNQNDKPTNKVFGYTPRYSEYKQRYSRVTGDYIIKSVNTDLEAYVTDRKFNPADWITSGQTYNITQSKEFAFAYDREQYNRIFYIRENITDPVYSVFAFDIYLEAPMKTKYDYYQFEHDDNSVNIEINGGFVN